MIRRNAADNEAAILVEKASQLGNEYVWQQPEENLAELEMIQSLVHEAHQVYSSARIVGWKNSELTALKARLASIRVPLAEASLNAFDQAITKSMAFRQYKTEVETLPVANNDVAKQALYKHLDAFNKDLKDCCVNRILLINRFLTADRDKFYGTMKLGQNTMYYMGLLIRGDITSDVLREKVSNERRKLQTSGNIAAQHNDRQ
ncbi:hypothetical protein OCL06_06010 [Alteromonas sp. ASW11-19]|uniref:Uncharacterized protein n=1 Tax=Alteromonas salexigens TaxID=2982530 RepID=A0ABT2VLF3_9ALTE|nr:hypothetical protein [Alteromonas salexigens]MCU7554146.1 hypothetical protein [Alteromonas salexigens]